MSLVRSGKPLRIPARRWGAGLLVLAGFLLAYGGTLSIILNQAALWSEPGDQLLVVFPRESSVATSLEAIGRAGAVVAGDPGSGRFYRAEVIDTEAAHRLDEHAFVLRVPTEPTLEGCFAAISDTR